MSLQEPFAIGLGSNLGDQRATLRWAVEELNRHPKIQPLRISALYRTQPVNTESDREFLNAVFLGQTDAQPEEVLELCMMLEKQAGRNRKSEKAGPPYIDRLLDLDLLFFGRRTILTDRLSIPHPEMDQRGFVLIPLSEVCPGWTHPVGGALIETLIDGLSKEPWVRLEEEEWIECER